jgi:hypothetical protein
MPESININAGVIEGLFGKPWSWAARRSGAEEYGKTTGS